SSLRLSQDFVRWTCGSKVNRFVFALKTCRLEAPLVIGRSYVHFFEGCQKCVTDSQTLEKATLRQNRFLTIRVHHHWLQWLPHRLVAVIVKKTPGENYARDDP